MPIKSILGIEGHVFSGVDVGDADVRRFPQSSQASRILGFARLDQTQPFTKNFAGILVTARGYESLDK